MTQVTPDELVSQDELLRDPRVRRLIRKPSALKAKLAARQHNGLAACGAVNMSATRKLLVHRERFVVWLYGLTDCQDKAA